MGIIYKILNLVNGKFYIGSTIRPLRIRKYEHLSSLRKNEHPNEYLQKSFNKYGEKNFKFLVIEKLNFDKDLSQKEKATSLVELEMKLISELSPDYNLKISMTIGKSGYKHTEETRKKISESNKKRFEGKALSNKTLYKKDLEKRKSNCEKFLPKSNKGRKHTQEAILKIKERSSREDNKLRIKEIQKIAAKNRIGTHQSFESKRKMVISKYGTERVIEMYDRNGNLINTFNFQPEIEKQTGIKRSAISNNLAGLSKSAGGYVFKYKIISQ